VVLTRLASLSLFSATEAPTTRFLKNCFRSHGGMFPWYRAHVRPLCLLWIAIHVGRRPWPYVDFMDGILHVQMENKHSASSKHPMDGILRALWWRCHPMDWKIKTTSNAFTDQPRLSTGSTTAYNTIRVFERWSTFNPASAVRNAPAHVPLALLSPLLPTASITPYFLRSSDPSAIFCTRPSARPFPFLLDLNLQETCFRRSHSCVLFFGRLQYHPSLDEFNTARPGDLHHNLRIFSSNLF